MISKNSVELGMYVFRFLKVGAIVRLYLKNFMQYSECEMLPGPTLNVIIGPNGSGKSSVVNGLALALGSKTNVLGRYEL